MSAVWSWTKRVAFDLLWLAIIASVAGAGANYAIGHYQREQAQQVPFVATAKAQRGDFIIYSDEVGNLEAEESTAVRVERRGVVASMVPNGTAVKEGDVIMILDVPRFKVALEEAQDGIRKAKSRIEATKHDRDADVRQAELALEREQTEQEQAQAAANADRKEREAQLKFDQKALAEDESRLERRRRQAAAGLIPSDEVRREDLRLAGQRFALEKEKEQIELEAAKEQKEAISKQAQIRLAQSALERAKARRDDDLKNAQIELEKREKEFKEAQEDLAAAIIRAPKAGTVALTEQSGNYGRWRQLQEGAWVWRNQEVAQVLDLSKIQVLLQLPQRVGPMVKKGQRAIVWVHGLPGQQFPGKVTQVSPFASQQESGSSDSASERTFRTCVRVSEFTPGLLRPGMRATVRIVIAEVKQAVSVPLVCVFTRGAGKSQHHVAWVRRGRSFAEVPVKLGQANEEAVIIESGLKPGTEIALRDLEAEMPRLARGAEASASRTAAAEDGVAR